MNPLSSLTHRLTFPMIWTSVSWVQLKTGTGVQTYCASFGELKMFGVKEADILPRLWSWWGIPAPGQIFEDHRGLRDLVPAGDSVGSAWSTSPFGLHIHWVSSVSGPVLFTTAHRSHCPLRSFLCPNTRPLSHVTHLPPVPVWSLGSDALFDFPRENAPRVTPQIIHCK